jgi:hypothetical protein
VLAALFIGFGIVFLLIFLTVLFWDSHRLLALGLATTVLLAAGVWAGTRAATRLRAGSRLLPPAWPRSPRTAKPCAPRNEPRTRRAGPAQAAPAAAQRRGARSPCRTRARLRAGLQRNRPYRRQRALGAGQRPILSGVAIFVLVARPRAALRWARRGWVGWQLFRRVQKLVS